MAKPAKEAAAKKAVAAVVTPGVDANLPGIGGAPKVVVPNDGVDYCLVHLLAGMPLLVFSRLDHVTRSTSVWSISLRVYLYWRCLAQMM